MGILGTIYGYDAIPDYWMQGLESVEDLDFAYTTISLNEAYEMSYQHALQMIRRQGGLVSDKSVTIPVQEPQKVAFEDSFENHFAKERRQLGSGGGPNRELIELTHSYNFDFNGIGFALMGSARSEEGAEDYVFEAELHVDGELVETATWPTDFVKRRFYLFWKYALSDDDHDVEIRLTNPSDEASVLLDTVIVYGAEPTLLN